MSDTNDSWNENLTRSEIEGLYDFKLEDKDWDALVNALDEAIGSTLAEFGNTY